MKINNLLDITTREELRIWLFDNHKFEECCWVIISITPKPNTLLYLDVVEEALCFGWIDGIKKKISDTQLAQRLSPRTNKSKWTELNKERVYRLKKLGLMTQEGENAFQRVEESSFYIDPHIEKKIKEDPKIYENFLNFPELYKRIRIDTIQREQKNIELFTNRLNKFLKYTRNNKMYGDWNDNGRLINH